MRGAQSGKPLADLSIPERYRWVPPAVPAGLPFNVAQLYTRMAEGIREGKSVSPDFDVAVNRHQLLDAIQKASDTGIPQILYRRSCLRASALPNILAVIVRFTEAGTNAFMVRFIRPGTIVGSVSIVSVQ